MIPFCKYPCKYSTTTTNSCKYFTPTTITLIKLHQHCNPLQNSLQSNSPQKQYHPNHNSLTNPPMQFAGFNHQQVVPLKQYNCYNKLTMLLFLQLYLIYYILIYM
eukprot:227127_1